MLYEFLITLYVINCIFLILIIMVQKTKGSMGLGNLGGGSQLLFGGSGGQDVFQKATWVMGLIFVFASLGLALMKARESKKFRFAQPIAAAQKEAK